MLVLGQGSPLIGKEVSDAIDRIVMQGGPRHAPEWGPIMDLDFE